MSAELAGAGRQVRRAARHPAVRGAARAGLVGFGVLHLLIGWLALLVAFGRPVGESDQTGALRQLAATPAGRWLVGAIALGLAAMVVWQGAAALAGHRGAHGARRVAERVVSAGRAAVYASAAWTCVAVLRQAAPSQGGQQQTLTARLLAADGGRWLVGGVGVIVAGIGAGLLVYGVRRGFRRHLDTGRMSAGARRAATALGVLGYAAKGVGYGTVGVLVLLAAVHADPRQSRGLDAALRTLAGTAAGPWLLVVVAAGFAGYAAYCGVRARYPRDL